MISDLQKQLTHIREETANFQSLVTDENWDELENALAERHKKLEHFFNQEIPDKDRQFVLDNIKQILEEDKAFAQQIKASKNESISESLKVKKQNAAAKAYKAIDNH